MHALKADTFRIFGHFNWLLAFKGMISNRAFRVVASLRLCQSAHHQSPVLRQLLLLPARIMHRLACQSAGIELPWKTVIAPGLALTHGRGIVVNAHARIGQNVTIFHGVTLGQRDFISRDGSRTTSYPVIEDDVWIGPHAIVVGATIGKGSRIAGGAYVFENIPPHSVVLGNPGKIVKTDCMPDVENRCQA
ncbi:MAG: serine O-acetyltransferase [Polaromonas sp.]|nr:serine O-acetyltransferase [Polaromonas sp.]